MKARQVFLLIASVLTLLVVVAWFLWGGTAANPFVLVGNWDGTSATPREEKTPSSSTQKPEVPKINTITYDGKNFNPRVLVLTRGSNLRFVNTSTLTMQISMTTTGAATLKQYTQATSVGKGGTYEISVSEPGTWNIVNINGNPKNNAIISVQ